MPLVTDSVRPSGAPAATTPWPTFSDPDSPNVAGTRFGTPETLITARSLIAEVPTIVPSAAVPSLKMTLIAPDRPAAPATWLLLRMWPFASSTPPVPTPPLLPLVTEIVTTDGSILAAAAATVPSRTGLLAAGTLLT